MVKVVWIPDLNLLQMNGREKDHGATQVLESMAHFDPEVRSDVREGRKEV